MGIWGSGGGKESCVTFWERSEENCSPSTIEQVMGDQCDCASLTEFQVSPLLSRIHTHILVKV